MVHWHHTSLPRKGSCQHACVFFWYTFLKVFNRLAPDFFFQLPCSRPPFARAPGTNAIAEFRLAEFLAPTPARCILRYFGCGHLSRPRAVSVSCWCDTSGSSGVRLYPVLRGQPRSSPVSPDPVNRPLSRCRPALGETRHLDRGLDFLPQPPALIAEPLTPSPPPALIEPTGQNVHNNTRGLPQHWVVRRNARRFFNFVPASG